MTEEKLQRAKYLQEAIRDIDWFLYCFNSEGKLEIKAIKAKWYAWSEHTFTLPKSLNNAILGLVHKKLAEYKKELENM